MPTAGAEHTGLFARVLFGPDGPRIKAVEACPTIVDGIHRDRHPARKEPSKEKDTTVEEASVSAASCRDDAAWSSNPIATVRNRLSRRPASMWFPTFWQIRPLSGIAALAVTAGCIVASLMILIRSDGQPVSDIARFQN